MEFYDKYGNRRAYEEGFTSFSGSLTVPNGQRTPSTGKPTVYTFDNA